MAGNVYRANVTGFEAAADGTVHFDVWVELRTGVSPDFVWTPAKNSHYTVVIQAQLLIDIYQGAGTNNVKRKAVEDLIKADVLSRGIDKADEGWQDTAVLEPVLPFQITVKQ